jgi:UDP-glucose 4-epimerase
LANSSCLKPYETFNVATGDYITVSEIARLAIECLGIVPPPVLEYTGGDRGWKGDIPIVRLKTDRIKSLGWNCGLSTREALRRSLLALIEDVCNKRL